MNKKRRSFRVIGKTAFAMLWMIKNKKMAESCKLRYNYA